jgi:hypothetical protein
LENDHLKIEACNGEVPQQISFLNPNFNNAIFYISEKKDFMYILYGVDVLELLNPGYDSPGYKTEKDWMKRKTNNNTMMQTAPAKYNNMKHTKPDITIDLVRRFVLMVDQDDDGKITQVDCMKIVNKHSLAITPEKITEMFNEIFQKRNVKVET